MNARNAKRTVLVAALVLAGTACASSGASLPDASWAQVEGPVCRVRVESSYDIPVEAGVTAGARQVYLGEVPTVIPDIENPYLSRLLGWADREGAADRGERR